MTRPRSQSQAARLQPRAFFTVLLQGSLWKRNSKLSFKIPEMDLLRQPSSALLLKKRRGKKKKEWFKPLWRMDTCSHLLFCTAFGMSFVDISWMFGGGITLSPKCSWTKGPRDRL